MKKKNLNLIINIVFILILLITFGLEFTRIFNDITSNSNMNVFLSIILSIFSSLLSVILDYYYVIIIFIGVKFGIKKYYKEKLDETDFEKNKDIYRDVINNYNISTLNYIDNFKLDIKQSYTAKLLELQRNKIISIDNDKIKVINESTTNIDKEFIKSINNNKITMSIEEYEKLCEEDALNNDLIVETDKTKKVTMLIFSLMIALFLYSAFFFKFPTYIINSVKSGSSNIPVLVIIFIIISSAFFGLVIFVSFYTYSYAIKYKNNPHIYNRTNKGKDINKKLDGLKQLIKEFGDISNKSSEQLVLWDDYLIYSVMFNQNKKIIDEYSKFIK